MGEPQKLADLLPKETIARIGEKADAGDVEDAGETDPCPRCNWSGLVKAPRSALSRFCRCPFSSGVQRQRQRHVTEDIFSRAGVPRRLQRSPDGRHLNLRTWKQAVAGPGGQIEKDKREALEAVEQYIERGSLERRGRQYDGLLLMGLAGTGKSGLMAALAFELYRQGYMLLWIKYKDLMRDIQSAYGTDKADLRLKVAQTVTMLFLDDLGDPFASEENYRESEDKRGLLFEIISARHERRLPTFLTSNHASMEEIAEQFDPRIEGRIRELCLPIDLDGRDLRE